MGKELEKSYHGPILDQKDKLPDQARQNFSRESLEEGMKLKAWLEAFSVNAEQIGTEGSLQINGRMNDRLLIIIPLDTIKYTLMYQEGGDPRGFRALQGGDTEAVIAADKLELEYGKQDPVPKEIKEKLELDFGFLPFNERFRTTLSATSIERFQQGNRYYDVAKFDLDSVDFALIHIDEFENLRERPTYGLNK